MGLLKFDILFDNSSRVYFAGQTVVGNVVLELSSPKRMKGVHLKIKGGAEVEWTETEEVGEGEDRHSEEVKYENEEEYFEYKYWIYGQGRETELPAGEHNFPFAYTLPVNIPSSFEGKWGHVRYTIKAKIDRPWKYDHEVKACFTVNSILDLNTELTASDSAVDCDQKFLCCLCCRTGPISVTAKIDRTGYVPGECIVFNGEADNQSNREMEGSKLKLTEVVVFHNKHKRERQEERTITTVVRGKIPPGESDIWKDVLMPVPPLPPSKLTCCGIIDIEYQLEFILETSGMSFDLRVHLPLIIGTIPLAKYFGNFQPAVSPPAGFIIPSSTGEAALAFNNYPGLSPPTYGESFFGAVNTFGRDDNEYTRGNLEFAPCYVSYNLGDELHKKYTGLS